MPLKDPMKTAELVLKINELDSATAFHPVQASTTIGNNRTTSAIHPGTTIRLKRPPKIMIRNGSQLAPFGRVTDECWNTFIGDAMLNVEFNPNREVFFSLMKDDGEELETVIRTLRDLEALLARGHIVIRVRYMTENELKSYDGTREEAFARVTEPLQRRSRSVSIQSNPTYGNGRQPTSLIPVNATSPSNAASSHDPHQKKRRHGTTLSSGVREKKRPKINQPPTIPILESEPSSPITWNNIGLGESSQMEEVLSSSIDEDNIVRSVGVATEHRAITTEHSIFDGDSSIGPKNKKAMSGVGGGTKNKVEIVEISSESLDEEDDEEFSLGEHESDSDDSEDKGEALGTVEDQKALEDFLQNGDSDLEQEQKDKRQRKMQDIRNRYNVPHSFWHYDTLTWTSLGNLMGHSHDIQGMSKASGFDWDKQSIFFSGAKADEKSVTYDWA